MEDGLVQACPGCNDLKACVLILIVMEDGLVRY